MIPPTVPHQRIFLTALLMLVAGVAGVPQAGAEQLTLDEVQLLREEKGSKLRDEDLERIATAADLTRLDLTSCGSLTDAGVAHLLQLPNLKSLDLSSCRRLTPKVFETLRLMKSLEHLAADQVGWATDVTPLADLPQLTSLSLARNASFQGKGLQHLRTLLQLDLSCGRGQFGDVGMEQIKQLTQLKSLDLDGQDTITDDGIRHLAQLTDLRHLGMYGCHRITDEAFNDVFGKLEKLQTLDLAFCWWHEGKTLQLPSGLVELDLHESKRLTDDALITMRGKSSLIQVEPVSVSGSHRPWDRVASGPA